MPTAWDLYCGAGGASEGLRRAGFTVTLAVDKDPWALLSHKSNHRETEHVRADVRTFDFSRYERPDYIHFSSPCQEVSTQTNGRPRDLKLAGDLLDAGLRVVEAVKPRLGWSAENVPGVRPLLDERGLKYVTLCAADYGVPQTRHRTFTGDFGTPVPTHAEPDWVGWGEALGLDSFAHLERGEGNGTLPIPHSRPCPTITSRGLIWAQIPNVGRFQLSLSDRLTMQGWPEARIFGPASSRQVQIGNLVPPDMMAAVARAALARLEVMPLG